MSDYINIKQFDEMNVTAKDDRIMYDVSHTSGVIKGCTISYVGGNTIHIAAGYGVIKGALFEIFEHDEVIPMTESGTNLGQIYLHLDLSSATPIDIIVDTGNTLQPLEQDEDANFDYGIYDIQLCTFTVGTTTLTNIVQTFPLILGSADYALDFVSNVKRFLNDGSIRTNYETGRYTIKTFPDGAISEERLYEPNGTLRATKTVTEENGDIVTRVVKN